MRSSRIADFLSQQDYNMGKKVSAIFDIGKTNKKFFLFDEDFNEVHREYVRFDEIPDDMGFLSEDLPELVNWMKSIYQQTLENPEFEVESLNFSTYGASLVHLDEEGNVATPFYNYLKPFPEELEKQFLEEHGGQEQFELETSSPFMGMLNSGLQLYYLKYQKPELFSKIKRSVHFPQYLSSLFTGEYVTDFTSLGCHTGLWDMSEGKYAEWVEKEGLTALMCPLVSTKTHYEVDGVRIGTGIHDSSSALIPYLYTNDSPFALVSTGTWSICINLYNNKSLTGTELSADCLNFLSIEGKGVKASRLFLGKHLSNVAKILSDHFEVDYQSYKSLGAAKNFVSKRKSGDQLLFDHRLIQPERFGFQNCDEPDYSLFDGYEDALYHFFDEITDIQIKSLSLAVGDSEVKNIYVDGGFSSSEVFIQFLADKLPRHNIFSSSFSLGSALGAAIVVNDRKLPDLFLEKIYNVKQTTPR